MIAAGFISLYLFSTGLVANLLISPLEKNYRPLHERVEADAIVILTSGVKDLSHLGLGPQPDNGSLNRAVHGYALHRKYPRIPVIVSGGKADPSKPDLSIGAALGKALLEFGVDKKNLIIEDDSQNTYEGALRVSEILRNTKKRIILVTSAYHMGRSVKLYKKTGFTLFPAPTDFIDARRDVSFHELLPKAHNMEISSIALYEYFTTLWYGAI